MRFVLVPQQPVNQLPLGSQTPTSELQVKFVLSPIEMYMGLVVIPAEQGEQYPQSIGQVEQVSPPLQTPSPQ